jgi:multicomponent Na+:H+ antiporter subunit B
MTERPVMLDIAVRGLFPVMMLASLWILLRGHNEPGGGFIAGMVAVAASSMVAVARGSAVAIGQMPLGPRRLAAASALLSLASGLPAVALGQAYMTHLWVEVPLGFTELALSTVMLFDLGVYGVVWTALGAICVKAIAMDEDEEESAL